MNRLAVSNLAWKKDEEKQYIELLNKLSIDLIEIAPTNLSFFTNFDDDQFIDNISKTFSIDNSMHIISLQSVLYGNNLNIHNEDEVDNLLKYMNKIIKFSSKLGCKNIVFGSPKNRSYNDKIINKKEALSKGIFFFTKIAEYCSAYDIVIALEPNPEIYECNFLTSFCEVVEFVKEMNNPYIKINLDLGSFIYNNESFDLIEENIDLINHVHISCPYLHSINVDEKIIKIINFLIDKGYNKFFSLEMKPSSYDEVKTILVDLQKIFKKEKK